MSSVVNNSLVMGIPEEDRLFAKLAVSQSLCTKEQVEECLATLERLAEAGVAPRPSLGELLRRRGYLGGTAEAESTLRASGSRPAEQGLPADAREAEANGANVFGKYVRTAKLGAGAMGEVWKAWDRELGRFIALKFLKHDDPGELARFRREAQTAGKLTHPNIAATYEVGEAQGRHFIAMQLVEGQTLETVPRDGVKRLVEIVRQAALAVDYAHGQEVIHRDLKPGNIMVTPAGHAYVMDFGLARSAQVGSSLSISGAIIGTPSFMSPEQAEGRRVDRRCDVYSLGATLYALLCDTPPFAGESLLETLRKVAHDEPVRPRRLNARIPNDLETIVLK